MERLGPVMIVMCLFGYVVSKNINTDEQSSSINLTETMRNPKDPVTTHTGSTSAGEWSPVVIIALIFALLCCFTGLSMTTFFLYRKVTLRTMIPPQKTEPFSTFVPPQKTEPFSTMIPPQKTEPFSTIVPPQKTEPFSTIVPPQKTEPFSTNNTEGAFYKLVLNT